MILLVENVVCVKDGFNRRVLSLSMYLFRMYYM